MALANTNAHVVEGTPKNGCRQCLCPQGELQLLPASLEDSPRSAGRSNPGFYQMTAFALGPGACEILCVPFKNEVSLSPSPLGLLKVNLTGLQSKMLWRLVFLMQDPWAGEPDVGLRPHSALGEPLQCSYSPIFGSSFQGYGT